jgi:hypothetical protein
MLDRPSQRVTWPVLASAAFLAAVAAVAGSASVHAAEPPAVTISEVLLPGAPDHGIFDPSVTADGTGRLYMSLSGVSSTPAGADVGDLAVSTYLAESVDQGRQWRLLGLINRSVAVPLRLGHSADRGRWQNEVSALVFDPYARPEARWKLFWHQYLNVSGVRRFQHGWIAYKQAASPAQLSTAKAIKLFTARAYDPVADAAAGWTHPIIAGPALVPIAGLARDISGCAAVTEPGVLARPEGLYLSLVCVRGSPFGLLGTTNRVILLECTRPCTAATRWSFVGTALTQRDAAALGMHKVSASDMFSINGHDFLTVSPVGTVPVPDSYKGCVVFRFADLSRARLLRDAAGRVQVRARADLGPDSFDGACSFLPASEQPGLLIGRLEIRRQASVTEATFHIFRTYVRP